jgi:hypothetical protein
MQYIVPNYFRECGKGKGRRNDLNIGERLYVVVEFDKGRPNDQLRLLAYLSRNGFQLIMIVYSGGKSLHGWFTCYGVSEYRIRTFCRLAKKLGADQTTRSPSQWVRMPNGWNYKNRRKQKVLYYDAEGLGNQYILVREELL